MTDSTPEKLHINVEIEGFRELCREKRLTRAEMGELLILATYIDENGECWPSKRTSTESVGMSAENNSRRIQESLREKGCLSWTLDHEYRSRRFRLPSCFFFGKRSYRDRNSDPGGGMISDPMRVSYRDPRGSRKSDPEQESSGTRSIRNETQHTTMSEPVGVADGDSDKQALAQRLIAAGVQQFEAKLIVEQFYPTTIDAAISAARRNPSIVNQGAWIRRTIERKAGQTIQYPRSVGKAISKTAAAKAAAAAEQQPDPFTAEFLRRQHGG